MPYDMQIPVFALESEYKQLGFKVLLRLCFLEASFLEYPILDISNEALGKLWNIGQTTIAKTLNHLEDLGYIGKLVVLCGRNGYVRNITPKKSLTVGLRGSIEVKAERIKQLGFDDACTLAIIEHYEKEGTKAFPYFGGYSAASRQLERLKGLGLIESYKVYRSRNTNKDGSFTAITAKPKPLA